MLVQPGLVGGLVGILSLRITQYAIDEPARKTFQSLVPEERRGRVSIFIESYLYFIGVVLGCVLTGVIVLLGSQANLPNAFYVYLALAVAAGALALWSIGRMRAVYDSSLLNWRLKRRQRGKSVLDKLEF